MQSDRGLWCYFSLGSFRKVKIKVLNMRRNFTPIGTTSTQAINSRETVFQWTACSNSMHFTTNPTGNENKANQSLIEQFFLTCDEHLNNRPKSGCSATRTQQSDGSLTEFKSRNWAIQTFITKARTVIIKSSQKSLVQFTERKKAS